MQLCEIKDIVVRTIQLTEEYHQLLETRSKDQEESDIFFSTSNFDLDKQYEERENLYNYLINFDDDIVLTIQAIMYLGRDGECRDAMGADEIIRIRKNELPFESKKTRVDRMIGKMRLSEHLKLGLMILDL